MKNHKVTAQGVPNGNGVRQQLLQRFFYGCPCHLAISDLLITLATHQQVQAQNVPVQLLPHVLLLHAVADEPGVVDDVAMLVQMMVDEFNNHERGPKFWHPELYLASGLIYGAFGTNDLYATRDAQYIIDLYVELTDEQARTKVLGWLHAK